MSWRRWIKTRTDLSTSPRVVSMAEALAVDAQFCRRLSGQADRPAHDHVPPEDVRAIVVDSLLRVWARAVEDGKRDGDDLILPAASAASVDAAAGRPGIAAAMQAVGWLAVEEAAGESRIRLPRFLVENLLASEFDQRRVERQERNREYQRRSRERKRQPAAVSADARSPVSADRQQPVSADAPANGQPVSADTDHTVSADKATNGHPVSADAPVNGQPVSADAPSNATIDGPPQSPPVSADAPSTSVDDSVSRENRPAAPEAVSADAPHGADHDAPDAAANVSADGNADRDTVSADASGAADDAVAVSADAADHLRLRIRDRIPPLPPHDVSADANWHGGGGWNGRSRSQAGPAAAIAEAAGGRGAAGAAAAGGAGDDDGPGTGTVDVEVPATGKPVVLGGGSAAEAVATTREGWELRVREGSAKGRGQTHTGAPAAGQGAGTTILPAPSGSGRMSSTPPPPATPTAPPAARSRSTPKTPATPVGPAPEPADLLSWFADEWSRRRGRGARYTGDWQRDGAALRALLDAVDGDTERARAVIVEFLADDSDPWLLENGHTARLLTTSDRLPTYIAKAARAAEARPKCGEPPVIAEARKRWPTDVDADLEAWIRIANKLELWPRRERLRIVREWAGTVDAFRAEHDPPQPIEETVPW